MQRAREARRKSAGTKRTGEEYGRIEKLAAQRGLTVGEWLRESLLAIARSDEPAASPIEQALLAEVLALRTIVVNLVYELASGQAVSAERMGELIGKADGEKLDRARVRRLIDCRRSPSIDATARSKCRPCLSASFLPPCWSVE